MGFDLYDVFILHISPVNSIQEKKQAAVQACLRQLNIWGFWVYGFWLWGFGVPGF